MYEDGCALELPEASTLGDLSVTNDVSSPLSSQHWRIDYLSYVFHFNTQDQDGTSVLANFVIYKELAPQLKSFVEEHKLTEAYAAMAVNTGDWLPGIHVPTKGDHITYEHLTLNIHREATWALCIPILEQLQSIVIPLSDIDRYFGSICRLSSLTNITFRLDELSDIDQHLAGRMDTEEVKKLGPRQAKRRQDLETAVKFVRTHAVMFPGTLKQVHCPSCRVQNNKQSCPAAVLDQMFELLPTLIDPLELVNKNWKQFTAKAEHTNMDHVKTIDVWEHLATKSYEQFKAKPFLHRCPSLRKYNMISLGPDSFKWAVSDLFKDQDQDQDRDLNRARPNVPPLEEVNIQARKGPFGSEVNDIGLGFGATLKSFTIQGYLEQQMTESRSLTIGRGWRMPVLSKLSVDFSSEKLVLDPDFLRYCPLLKLLSLSDCRATYNLNEIKVAHPAYLPELTNLVLSGSAALAFHPDTLHSATELRRLTLGSAASFRATIAPSIQDIDRDDHQDTTLETGTTALMIHRPKWTWDWHLPSLGCLHLTVEFAFHFQFRMLQGTPNLRELYLSLYSTVHPLERVLTKADFTVSRLQGRDQDDGDAQGDPTSPQDLNDSVDLKRQPLQVLNGLHSYLMMINQNKKLGSRSTTVRAGHSFEGPPLSGWSLELYRERVMGRTIYRTIHTCPNHLDGSCPENGSPESAADKAQEIEGLVDQAGLQPEFEAALAELRVWRARERQEERDLKNYRVEHPEKLVVPSLKKLELFGRWIISDEVLEILLGRVFRNVETLGECLTEGYSWDTFVGVTLSMPWLAYVNSLSHVDTASLSDEHKLQPQPLGINLPFRNDARTRICYQFSGNQRYSLGPRGGSKETEEVLGE